jgi:hypothetical protein
MAPNPVRWHVILEEPPVKPCPSDADFVRAFAGGDYTAEAEAAVEYAKGNQQGPDEVRAVARAAAVADAAPSRAIDQGANTIIDLQRGCNDIAANSNIVAIEVTSLVVLSKYPCNAFAPPFLGLVPTALGTPTIRALPADWKGTVRSALTWY